MGYIKHNAIIVIGFELKELVQVREKAIELFYKNFKEAEVFEGDSTLIGEIIRSISNGYNSFYIAPDGSKEGWTTSNCGDDFRKEFLEWLNINNDELGCDYIDVKFGGDDSHNQIEKYN